MSSKIIHYGVMSVFWCM